LSERPSVRRCPSPPRRAARFDPRQVVELLLTIGYCMMIARLLGVSAA
jgi:hypothetical protein